MVHQWIMLQPDATQIPLLNTVLLFSENLTAFEDSCVDMIPEGLLSFHCFARCMKRSGGELGKLVSAPAYLIDCTLAEKMSAA